MEFYDFASKALAASGCTTHCDHTAFNSVGRIRVCKGTVCFRPDYQQVTGLIEDGIIAIFWWRPVVGFTRWSREVRCLFGNVVPASAGDRVINHARQLLKDELRKLEAEERIFPGVHDAGA